jgi:hypothetical protein
MPTLSFRVETESKILPARDAAIFLLSLATIRDGLRIAQEGEDNWISRSILGLSQTGRFVASGPNGPVTPPLSLHEYTRFLGRELLAQPPGFLPFDPFAWTLREALSLIGAFYPDPRGPSPAGEGGLRLVQLSSGSMEGVIEDIFSWFGDLFGSVLGSARGLLPNHNSREYYDTGRNIVSQASGARELGGGLFVLGGAGLQRTLFILRAKEFGVTKRRGQGLANS